MNKQPKTPKAYLAGPGVFRPDADDFAAKLQALCARYGLEGLWPADGPADSARLIFRANIVLIRSADAIIADISPFRGPTPTTALPSRSALPTPSISPSSPGPMTLIPSPGGSRRVGMAGSCVTSVAISSRISRRLPTSCWSRPARACRPRPRRRSPPRPSTSAPIFGRYPTPRRSNCAFPHFRLDTPLRL